VEDTNPLEAIICWFMSVESLRWIGGTTEVDRRDRTRLDPTKSVLQMLKAKERGRYRSIGQQHLGI
jgi:hypothetical protein